MNQKNEQARTDVRDRSGRWVDESIERVVEHIASGRWDGKAIGQIPDEGGELIAYVLGKRAILNEHGSDFRTGISVRRVSVSDSHPMPQLDGIDQFSDDEKQLCIQRASEAMRISQSEEIGYSNWK